MSALRAVEGDEVSHADQPEPSRPRVRRSAANKPDPKERERAKRARRARHASIAETLRYQMGAFDVSEEQLAKLGGATRGRVVQYRKADGKQSVSLPVLEGHPMLARAFYGARLQVLANARPAGMSPGGVLTAAAHALSELAALVEDGKITPDERRKAKRVHGEMQRVTDAFGALVQAVDAMADEAEDDGTDLPRARPRRRPAQGARCLQ